MLYRYLFNLEHNLESFFLIRPSNALAHFVFRVTVEETLTQSLLLGPNSILNENQAIFSDSYFRG